MKAWKHFCTITYHRWLVMLGCFRLGLYRQGLMHDLSKYSPTEFLAGCKYYTGSRSPNDLQRMQEGYSASWLHHKGRNKHHLEYWIDYNLDREADFPLTGMKMPARYVAEMFCDRVAASKVYQKEAYTDHSALDYYLRGRSHLIIHQESAELLEKMLTILAEEGEEKAFRYIKKEILQKEKRKSYDKG